jgi:beta-aspartyl-peptidase (threonine type)
VGDSPVIGAGAFADNCQGAVSATGYGVSIMKVLHSKLTCDEFEKKPAMKAAQDAIPILPTRVKGLGGIIGITSTGEYTFFHNTEYMAMAYNHETKRVIALIQSR